MLGRGPREHSSVHMLECHDDLTVLSDRLDASALRIRALREALEGPSSTAAPDPPAYSTVQHHPHHQISTLEHSVVTPGRHPRPLHSTVTGEARSSRNRDPSVVSPPSPAAAAAPSSSVFILSPFSSTNCGQLTSNSRAMTATKPRRRDNRFYSGTDDLRAGPSVSEPKVHIGVHALRRALEKDNPNSRLKRPMNENGGQAEAAGGSSSSLCSRCLDLDHREAQLKKFADALCDEALRLDALRVSLKRDVDARLLRERRVELEERSLKRRSAVVEQREHDQRRALSAATHRRYRDDLLH